MTEAASAKARVKLLEGLNERDLIVFSPEAPMHTITVFTDIDCTYCRKLHAEIDDYLRQGIAVRYAAFPRAGVASTSYGAGGAVVLREGIFRRSA